jgi:hypothetical protein
MCPSWSPRARVPGGHILPVEESPSGRQPLPSSPWYQQFHSPGVGLFLQQWSSVHPFVVPVSQQLPSRFVKILSAGQPSAGKAVRQVGLQQLSTLQYLFWPSHAWHVL